MSRPADVTLDKGQLKAFFTDDDRIIIQNLTHTMTVEAGDLQAILNSHKHHMRRKRREGT